MPSVNSYERKVITSKGQGPRYEREFFLEIQSLILEGWRIAETDTQDDLTMRNFRGVMGRAVFYRLKNYYPENPYEELEGLNNKEPLLRFAETVNVEIPESVKVPSAIKKYIRKAMEARNEGEESEDTTPPISGGTSEEETNLPEVAPEEPPEGEDLESEIPEDDISGNNTTEE
jgi:hypothetical protein